MEKRALELIAKIDEMGGMLKAVENGFPQREIAESAFRWQREVETDERLVVGVNAFQSAEGAPIPTLKVHDEVQVAQIERLRQLKATRDGKAVAATLAGVEKAAREGSNVMPPIIAAVKVYATLGEISDVCRKVFGVYRDDGRF
jgi:methylmalonyl-CoA mutase N-terminal domain/subunit